jgi:hypothetical protein
MPFQKAIRTQKKLRMALEGPSGSGKTFTALQIAKGLGSKIALIDTERGSASLYADVVPFDVVELEYFAVDEYIKAIDEASEAGYDVLIIDSLSHAWQGLGGVLDAVNNTKGNTFTDGWGKVGTPQQNRLLDAILKCPCHVIVTLRVKTDYQVEKDERGKVTPKKVGLAPVQRDGVEYEFDIVGSLSLENTLTIDKSRMIDLAGKIIPKPDAKLGAQVLAWLNSGETPKPKYDPYDLPAFRKILSEEMARLRTWLANDRALIIEAFKAVKGVAVSMGMTAAVAQYQANNKMSAQEIAKLALDLANVVNIAIGEAEHLQAQTEPATEREQIPF